MHLVKVASLIFYFIATSRSMQLNCEYIMTSSDGYNCRARGVIINQMNQTVTSKNGTHVSKLGNNDVKTFYVHSEDQFKYLPIGLSDLFPKLNKFNVERTPLKIINKSDFIGLSGIKIIHFTDNLIESFAGDTLSTLVQLTYIDLRNNSIDILASNTFEYLKDIEEVYFQDNQIQFLDSLLFQNNDKLKSISFNRNKLINIGPVLIRTWNKITLFEMFGNPCINNSYTNSQEELFKQEVANCNAPMVLITLKSYEMIKNNSFYFETMLNKTKIKFEELQKSSIGEKPEDLNDGTIVNKVEVVVYFFKTVLNNKQIVYTSVICNFVLMIVIFIRCSRKKSVTQINDTTLILQQRKSSRISYA